MSVALRTITRLQDADDINVNLGAGVDEYALCWDNDTARFALGYRVGETVPPQQDINLTSIATPSAPVAAVAGDAGNPNGSYQYIVTYVGAVYETAWSADSNTVTPASKKVNVTIPVSSSALVTARKLYRTKAGVPDVHYLLATISDNTTTLYVDNTADAALGGEIPHGLINSAFTAGRLLIDGHTLLRESGHELAIGRMAGGTASASSYNNIYIGEIAGQSVENGAYNTVVGSQAAPVMNNPGNFVVGNTVIGTKAANSLLASDYNTMVGSEAGRAATTGNGNTLLGESAGYYGSYPLTTGSNNTILGKRAGLGSATQRSYLTVIGADAVGDTSNAVVLGRAADSVIFPGGAIRPAADGTTAIAVQKVDGTPVLTIDTTNSRILPAGSLQVLNGTTPSPTAKIYAYAATSTNIVANAIGRFDHSVSGASVAITQIQYGVIGSIYATASGVNAISDLRGSQGEVVINNVGAEVVWSTGLRGDVTIVAGTAYATAALKAAVSIYGGTVYDAFGLYIENIAGAVSNYAIYTNAGLVRFGDIVNFAGTMGNSSKNPTTDAPADWVEVQIGGVTRYLPAYAAS